MVTAVPSDLFPPPSQEGAQEKFVPNSQGFEINMLVLPVDLTIIIILLYVINMIDNESTFLFAK